jgi:hypothetical protein
VSLLSQRYEIPCPSCCKNENCVRFKIFHGSENMNCGLLGMTLCNIISGNQYLEEPTASIFPIDHVFQDMEGVNKKSVYMNAIYINPLYNYFYHFLIELPVII